MSSFFAAIIALVTGTNMALAGGLATKPVTDPLVLKECGACHMAYPAGLLPACSWSALTGNLKDHFGDNAELDAAQTKAISDYLTANAADAGTNSGRILRDLRAEDTPMRITQMPWWTRKHEKKNRVAPQTLARKGAKFKGACNACHTDAAKGIFEDD